MRGREAGGLRGSRGMVSPSSLFLLSETNLLRRTTKFLIEWPYPNPAINHHCQIYVKISFSVKVIYVGKLRHCLKERSQKKISRISWEFFAYMAQETFQTWQKILFSESLPCFSELCWIGECWNIWNLCPLNHRHRFLRCCWCICKTKIWAQAIFVNFQELQKKVIVLQHKISSSVRMTVVSVKSFKGKILWLLQEHR